MPRRIHAVLESLEPRIALSASAIDVGVDVAAMSAASRRYRTDALADSLDTAAPSNLDAQQQYYALWLAAHAGPSAKPLVLPTPPTTPVAPETPADPVTVSVTTFATFSQLVITGTAASDSITVTQSGNTLVIVANNLTSTYTGDFAQLAIYAGDGNDAVTVTSTVSLETFLYAGAGSDSLASYSTGRNTIVAVGGGADTLTGNATTSYWADASDTLNITSAERASARVHTIASFYQPFSTDPANPDYVPLDPLSQNLRDPSGPSSTIRLANRSLFGLGPVYSDVNQGQLSDCYYLADLAALAHESPTRLRDMAVDLGDGTYAVQFAKSGSKTFVRVDGDLGAAGGGLLYSRPGPSQNIWAPIMEKAYAFARTLSQNSYRSLDFGWMGAAFSDLAVASTTISTSSSTLYTTVRSALSAGRAVTLATNYSVTSAPVVGSHAYTVIDATRDSAGNVSFVLYNPWGFDGAGSDGNTWDGLVTLSLAQIQQNFTGGSVAN